MVVRIGTVGLIDDSSIEAQALTELLEAAGHSVRLVESSLHEDVQCDLYLVWEPAAALQVVDVIRARYPNALVICALSAPNPSDIHRLVEAGVRAVVPRSMSPSALNAVLQVVGAGLFVSAVSLNEIAHTRPRVDLTETEQDLLQALANARTVSALADTIGYSRSSTSRRLRNLYRSLGVTNRSEALLIAGRLGFGDDPEVRVNLSRVHK